MLIRGKCHCGNVGFALDWQPDPAEIRARACGCSFCCKHGGVWTSNPGGRLRISIADPGQLSRYAFGTRTAEFLVCSRCGVVPVVTSRIDGRLYAVVNVNAFENVDAAIIRRSPADFEGEAEAGRLERRRRHWIADVDFEPPGLPLTAEGIAAFIADFEGRRLPRSRWTHQAHLLVGLWYLWRHPPAEALPIVRERIRAHNEAVGTPNTDDSGYHETITRLYLEGIAAHRARHDAAEFGDCLQQLLRSPLAHSGWPLEFYTRERLFSVAARRQWVEPDLRPLP